MGSYSPVPAEKRGSRSESLFLHNAFVREVHEEEAITCTKTSGTTMPVMTFLLIPSN